jgi:hypothetical protein
MHISEYEKQPKVRVRVKQGARIAIDRGEHSFRSVLAKPGEWIEFPESELRNQAIADQVETQEQIDAAKAKVEQAEAAGSAEQEATRTQFFAMRNATKVRAEAAVATQEAVELDRAAVVAGSESSSEHAPNARRTGRKATT